MDGETVFTKIINGTIPCHKVYEDERTFAFMDIRPVQPGMVVVVTKNPVDNVEDLPDEDYQALWQAVRTVARRLRKAFPDKKKIGIQVEGLEVPHAHVKMFPIDTGQEFKADPPGEEIEPDHTALAELAKKLQAD